MVSTLGSYLTLHQHFQNMTLHTLKKKVLSTNTINCLGCPVCVHVQEKVCVLMSSRGFGVSSDSSLKYRGCFCPKRCWSVNAPPIQRCPQAQSELQPLALAWDLVQPQGLLLPWADPDPSFLRHFRGRSDAVRLLARLRNDKVFGNGSKCSNK